MAEYGITYLDGKTLRRDVVTYDSVKLMGGGTADADANAKWMAQQRAKESVRPVGFKSVRVVLVDDAFRALPMIGDR
jgi:hypothetical protein